MRSRSHKFAILAFVLAITAVARACLRPTLDERAIQWATVIAEARLESIGDVVGAKQIYKFKIADVLDGSIKAGDAVHVVRIFADDAAPSRCPVTLKGKQVCDRFIMLLRPAQKDGEMEIVHLLNRVDIDDAAMTDLKARIADVRRAEEGATDDAVAAQSAALATAQDAVEAEEAEKSILQFGPRALPALQKKLDEPDLTDAGRTRLRRMIAELTPPPLPSEPRD